MKHIVLDGTLKSTLDWSEQKKLVDQETILWELDLGLFDRLLHPISNEMQLRSLGLSIEHFSASFWPEVSEQSRGVCLYQGPLDFSLAYPWDEEQEENFLHWCQENSCDSKDPFMKKLYCRDAATEYLNLLVNFLPESITPYLLLDASSVADPFECARLLDPEKTERFQRAIKGSCVMTRDLVWDDELIPAQPVNTGLFLPHSSTYRECLASNYQKGFCELAQKEIPYRLIAEDHLIKDWDGLDYLIVDPGSVSTFGKRKIMGFCAAGGTVVTLDDTPFDVPMRIGISEFVAFT